MWTICLLASAVLCHVQGDEFLDRALELLDEVPLVDGHNDFPWSLAVNTNGDMEGVDLDQDICDVFDHPNTDCHTDIPKLREGRSGAAFFAIFTRCNVQYKNGVGRATEIVDIIKRMVTKYSDFFQYVTDADGISAAHSLGKFAALIGLEGGHMIGESLSVLRQFYDLGVRYMTLAWNCNTGWADYSNPEGDDLTSPVYGLSSWGERVVREMNRLGMLVDLSHVSPATMHAALDTSLAPVIFSHSSAHALCPHRRNVPDDVLDRLPENGGVIMINFYNKFLNCTADNAYVPGFRPANVQLIVEHMEYVRDRIGAQYVGIGSDYDGMDYVPDGAEDTSQFPNVVAEMLRRGWQEDDVRMVMGSNLIRVLREAEQVRDSLADVEPDGTPIPDGTLPDDSCSPPFVDV